MAEPLFASQWHLHDGTQRTGYYEQAHLAQDHLGVQGVWKQQVYGVGVTVAVVDDGLDHAHADFSGRYQPALSHDYNSNDEDPAPRSLDSHGTSAAGLIAAGASDHTCGVGVAPLAAIAGIRLIADYVDDYTEALALTRRDDAVAVYSNSWGPADDGARLEAPGVLTQLAMEEAVRSGRNGLGTVYVWASGNGRHHGDSCAYDGYASSRLVIAVGAVGYFGNAAYYSEGCAALLCVAPSSASEGPDDVRRVTSSDLRGSYGATSGDCTGDFGGTSAAAPLVAGVVALLLSKVPTLGWRDVQHLIAHTAVRVDATHPSWRKNAADLWFSHLYGFGRVNASAALELALQWSPLPATELVVVTNTSANFSSLPVAAGLRASELTLRIDEQLTIEFVDVYLSIDHPRRGALEIMLTSPAGTVSELASLHPDTNANYAMWRFGSRAVLGERAAGTWRLSVRDIASAVSRGNVRYAELRVYGHTV
jgi:subtilisin family serine protease